MRFPLFCVRNDDGLDVYSTYLPVPFTQYHDLCDRVAEVAEEVARESVAVVNPVLAHSYSSAALSVHSLSREGAVSTGSRLLELFDMEPEFTDIHSPTS